MSYTCLAAEGYEVGNSLLEEYDLDVVRKMLKRAEKQENKIILPVDNYIITFEYEQYRQNTSE